jgi:hypothetical protein
MSFPLSLFYTFLIIMSYSSISTRADSMADEGYNIVKIMNYAEDDFPELIAKVNALEQIDIKEMEQTTHLAFGRGGRRFTILGAKKCEGQDWKEWGFLPGQQIELSDLIDCSDLTNTTSPVLKNCPIRGRNSTPFLAVAFKRFHSSKQVPKVCFEIIEQVKAQCIDDKEIEEFEDEYWLDVRYSRKAGYVLHALSTKFTTIMKAVSKISSKVAMDSSYGKFMICNTTVAGTMYRALGKTDKDDTNKGVMFNIPPETTEEQIVGEIMKIYKTLSEVTEEGRKQFDMPEKLIPVSEDEFEVTFLDGQYQNGETFRMAFVECPNADIFEFPEIWRTTQIFKNDRPSILKKSKRNGKAKQVEQDEGKSKSLSVESGRKRRNGDRSPQQGTERDSKDGKGDTDSDDEFDDSEDEGGEGDADLEVEEVEQNFGKAGNGGTPMAELKNGRQIRNLKRQLDSLTKKPKDSLSKADIANMIKEGNSQMQSNMDGQMTAHHSNTMGTLTKINAAYTELADAERERAELYKKALSDLRESLLGSKVPQEKKDAALAKVDSMNATDEQKEQFKQMMLETIASTHEDAVTMAVDQIQTMAGVVDQHMLTAANAKELTASNVQQLMIEALPMPATPEESGIGSSGSSSSAV